MRMGWHGRIKGLAAAAGLALAALGGVAHAAQQAPAAPVAAPVTSPAQESAAAPAGAANTAPTTAAATPPAAPDSPLLAVDGAPGTTSPPGTGVPTNRHFGLQPQVTMNGEYAHWFHNTVLFPTITIISLLVLALLVWVVLRYRARANPIPSKTSHNTTIEVIWTLLPVLALVAIAVPSISLLQAQFKPAPAGAVTLKAIGNQWYWTYQYPDHGGFEVTANLLKEQKDVQPGERYRTDRDGPRLLATDNRIVLPVGVPIRLITTANDVIHSWAVPAFWIKLDAIPGRLNETSFTIEKPGLYFGQCSELCGARHAYMPIAVEAVTPAVFAQWVAAKGGTMPAAGRASGAVIPQPGADTSATSREEATDAAAGSDAVTNATITAPAQTQGATRNPAGPGNAGNGGQ
jgi:cytochrome c oxidase subunit II